MSVQAARQKRLSLRQKLQVRRQELHSPDVELQEQRRQRHDQWLRVPPSTRGGPLSFPRGPFSKPEATVEVRGASLSRAGAKLSRPGAKLSRPGAIPARRAPGGIRRRRPLAPGRAGRRSNLPRSSRSSALAELLRRGRDSNPRLPFGQRPLSKRVPSATRSPLPKGAEPATKRLVLQVQPAARPPFRPPASAFFPNARAGPIRHPPRVAPPPPRA